MIEQPQSAYYFRLANGLRCHLTLAPTWQMRLFSEIPVLQGEPARFQAAANHLIEHAVMDFDDNLFERGCTRLNLVKLELVTPKTIDEAQSHLNRLGEVMTHPILKHLDSERERIFEEWAGACPHIKQDLKNWGSFTKPASPDNLDPTDPSLTWDKALSLLNRQADWTKAFTEKELIGQMKFLFGAEHLLLKVSGPISPPAFYRMLKHSSMADIPTRHPDALQIGYRDVPATTDYAKIQTSTTRIPLNIPTGQEELYNEIMHRFANVLRRDKEIALYWVRRHKTDNTTNWSFTITAPKENLMKAVLWGEMLTQTILKQGDTDIRRATEDIMFQAKDALKRNEFNASSQNHQKWGGRD